MLFDSTKLIIDLDAIKYNIASVKKCAGQQKIMAVVKADAYGHGAVQVARLLTSECDFFGVSSILEAMELREAGITLPILILGNTPVESFPEAIQNQIRPAIYSYEDAAALSNAAVSCGIDAPFHFALDTGMSRIGFQVTEESAEICARIASLPGLIAEGLFSHYATADCTDLSRAKAQAARFAAFDSMLKSRGIHIPLRHLNNSAGIMNFPGDYDMVRSGIITYGMYPSDEVDPALLPIRPAMKWVSRITHLKPLETGRQIGYGGTYTVSSPRVVATIPVGYADGYRRNLSNKFWVLIHGKKAPILGRVCMDQLMVDVTDIPGISCGEQVVLMGTDGDQSISAEEISAHSDSFNYEFVCGISRRVPREYIMDGKAVCTVHYLLNR